MSSYIVKWIRPTTFLNDAREATVGFQVRIQILPWKEARDLYVESDTAEVIEKAAKQAVANREEIDKLSDTKLEAPKKKSK